MSVPRIQPVEPPYTEQVQASFGRVMPEGAPPLKLFATLAHNPRVLDRFLRGGLLDKGTISLREREIVILRTTARCGSEYEWGVHVRIFAGAAEFSQAEIEATVGGLADNPLWSDREQLLLRLCDTLVGERHIPDALWASLSEEFETGQIVELVVLCGFYQTVSLITESFKIDREEGAPRFHG